MTRALFNKRVDLEMDDPIKEEEVNSPDESTAQPDNPAGDNEPAAVKESGPGSDVEVVMGDEMDTEEDIPDVLALMNAIQERAEKQPDVPGIVLSTLLQQLEQVVSSVQANDLPEAQDETNRVFQNLLASTSELRLIASPVALQELSLRARLGVTHRSGLDPRKLIVQIRGRFLRRQEEFNLAISNELEIIRRDVESISQSVRDEFTFCARVLGSLNLLVQHVIHLDKAVGKSSRELMEAIPALLGQLATRAEINDVTSQLEEMRQSSVHNELKRKMRWMTEDIHAAVMRLRTIEKSQNGMTSEQEVQSEAISELRQAIQQLSKAVVQSIPEEQQTEKAPVSGTTSEASLQIPKFNFLAFEDLTRGTETTISSEQEKYLTWFKGEGPVLDAGCGRGEFLEVLRQASIPAIGIDSDVQMVAHCKAKGLDVQKADLLVFLEAQEPESLGGLFLGQVVEHLQPAVLARVCELAARTVRPGGAVVMETINPACLTTFSGAFYADPTHVKPVHPKALEYFLTAAGFTDVEIIYSAPVPPDQRLAPIREKAPVEPVVKDVIRQINANLDRLNSVMYSYGNYAAAARKPE